MARRPKVPSSRLPDFLVIGASKAGTTSLAAYLAAHPQIFMARRKEVRYFDTDGVWEQGEYGLAWYRTHFEGSEGYLRVGEATPTYLSTREGAARIKATLPDAKLIVMLREPGARAYSHWCHAVAWKGDDRTFDEIVALPEPARDDEIYLWQSHYVPQLKSFFAEFPREQVHVLLIDDMKADLTGSFADVCRFLGVGTDLPVKGLGDVHNALHALRWVNLRWWMDKHARRMPRWLSYSLHRLNSKPISFPPMSAESRERLTAMFADEVAELETLIGRDLSAWKAPQTAQRSG
ncbi:MAG TPA: sulfotransferase [Mycobacteriales bacterium]|nr:sulfotransferase [Mycobacteriales bacterium]